MLVTALLSIRIMEHIHLARFVTLKRYKGSHVRTHYSEGRPQNVTSQSNTLLNLKYINTLSSAHKCD